MNIKQAIYTLLDKAKHRFRGAIGEGTVNLGEIDSITPTQDGWLVITAQPNASITIAPIIRVSNRTNTIYEYTGSMYSGGIMIGSLPVKKGETYEITYYRCSKKTSYIAYSGGGHNPCNINAFSTFRRVVEA